MKFLVYLTTLLLFSTAVAQNPTILQGNYISNVFGQSNFVKNPNAQTGVTNVTLTTATATRSTTTPLVATTEWNVTITSANGTAAWATRTFDAGMKNQNCEARFTYRGFQATSKAQIKQGTNVVAELVLTPSATDPRIASINFPCGDLSSATTFVITDTATLGGINEIGGIYVGLATNMANIAQAEMVGGLTTSSLASRVVGPANVWTDFTGTAGVATPIGKATSGSTSMSVTFPNLPAGEYQVVMNQPFFIYGGSAAHSCRLAIYETNSGIRQVIHHSGSVVAAAAYTAIQAQTTARFSFTTAGSRTFKLQANNQGWSQSANGECYAEGSQSGGIFVYRFPSSSELVVTPETQNVWGAVKYSGSSDYLRTTGVSDSIVNTTVFGTPSFFGGASVSSSACGLTTNDIGMCLQNVPPGTYQVSTNLEFGYRYADGTPGFAICSSHVAVTGSSLATTKTSSALAYSPVANAEDWSQLGTGIVKIDSLQSYLSIVVKVTKTTSAGGCRIRSASTGSSLNSHPTITFKPIDNNANSALYVQGPVKAAGTGTAIPEGYVGEVRSWRQTGCGTNGTYNAGAGLPLPVGVWKVYGTATLSGGGSISDFLGFIGPGPANTAWRLSFYNDSWWSGISVLKLPIVLTPFYVRYDGTNLYYFDMGSWGGATASATGAIYMNFYRSSSTCSQVYTQIQAERIN